MYSSLSSRNLVFNSNNETTRLLECYVGKWKEWYTCVLVRGQMEGTVHLCIGMWTDGRNGASVYWLDFVTIGMRLVSACAVKGTSRVPCSLQRSLLSVVCWFMTVPASEACPSLDGGVSDN